MSGPVACVLICCIIGIVQPATGNVSTGMTDRKHGYKQYVEYHPGSANSKLIITAPHGGRMMPEDIPLRTHGCWDSENGVCLWNKDCGKPDRKRCRATTVNDAYTKEIATILRDEVERLTGERPHLIYNNLYRNRLDPNRPVDNGAQDNADAIRAWWDFHNSIRQAKGAIRGRGLLLDIHGQGHKENWVELGYLFRTPELDSGSVDPNLSSIKSLAQNVGVSFWQLLNGRSSFGGLLEAEGYKVVPSPAHPTPKGGKYYRGGYITQVYGSRDGGIIDAIQIESPRSLRNKEKGPAYTKALARSVVAFMQRYYRD